MNKYVIYLTIFLFSINFILCYNSRPICLEIDDNDNEHDICNIAKVNNPGLYKWWKLQRTKRIQGTTKTNEIYTNVTIMFKRKEDIGFLQIVPSDNVKPLTLWNIKLTKISDIFPKLIKIAFIPLQADVTNIRKYTKETQTERSCSKRESITDCRILNHNSTVILLRKRGSTDLVLTVKTAELLVGLYVELLSCSCQVNCEKGAGKCANETLQVATDFLRNSSQQLIFDNLQPNNYCAIVTPLHECCRVCSENEVMEKNASNKPVEVIYIRVHQEYANMVWIATIFGFIVLISIIINYFLENHRISLNIRNKSIMVELLNPKDISNEEEVEEQEVKITDVCRSRIEILLLYPTDSKIFLNVMITFRNLLELYVEKVWDPHDDKQTEDIFENWWNWLEKILEKPNIKIILVETEKSKEWFFTNNFEPNPVSHVIENIFYYAIARIHDNQHLCRDYKRIFRIRFDINSTDMERVNFIVPFTSYAMPQHFNNLIEEVTGKSSFKEQSTVQNNDFKEKKNFEDALKIFKDIKNKY